MTRKDIASSVPLSAIAGSQNAVATKRGTTADLVRSYPWRPRSYWDWLAYSGRGPSYFKQGNMRVYDLAEVEQLITQEKINCSSEHEATRKRSQKWRETKLAKEHASANGS